MCQMPWVDGDADMLSTVGMPDFGDLEQDCGLTDSVRDEVVCLFTTLGSGSRRVGGETGVVAGSSGNWEQSSR